MIIIQDSAEQKPFDFTFFDNVEKVIVKKIPTGDYTLEGFEDIFTIERKASVDEIANNFGRKHGLWWKEMRRMSSLKHRFIVCEFPIDHVNTYPKHSRVPNKDDIKMTPMIIMKNINKCISEFGVEVFFCEDKFAAEEKAYQILTQMQASGKEELF